MLILILKINVFNYKVLNHVHNKRVPLAGLVNVILIIKYHLEILTLHPGYFQLSLSNSLINSVYPCGRVNPHISPGHDGLLDLDLPQLELIHVVLSVVPVPAVCR